MMKTVELKEYTPLGNNPHRTVYVNPSNVCYIYAVQNAGMDMTVIVFNGDCSICVLGNMEEIKRKLEEV